ncbi:MAG: hypothetical protein WAW37_13045 [Syntrophobacteraceae bacterium]
MLNRLPQTTLPVIFLSFFVFLSLTACGTTVRTRINDSKFISENHPIRELRVLVATDGSYDRKRVASLIAEVSKSLDEQVGIRLKPIGHVDITWEQRGPIPMLQRLYERTSGYDTDIVIGFGSKAPLDMVATSLLGGWQAVIDDTFRRYIVMTGLDSHNLAHEICHAFILTHAHGGAGLMQPASVQIVPGVTILQSKYLSVKDRQEVLKNKWRDFSEVQELNIEEQEHPINLTSPNPFKDASR